MALTHYLLRRMLRAPGFCAIVIMTIALAVGVNLGVFTLAKVLLLQSLGLPEADRLVYYTLGNGADTIPRFSGPAYEALRSNAMTADILAWQPDEFRLKSRDELAKVSGAYVTGNAFSVLNIQPSLGRFFNMADDAPGGGKDGWTAVLGYSFWRTHFNADPNVVGQGLIVDGVPVHILGVLPKSFTSLSPLYPANILLPRHFQTAESFGQDNFTNPNYLSWIVFGRLPRGASLQNIQANLQAIEPWFRQASDPKGAMFTSSLFSNTPRGTLLGVQDGRLGVSIELKTLRSPILGIALLAASVFLFCISNLVLLFIARARREAHHTAIRIALGSRLSDEARLAMLEATALAGIACLVSIPIAWAIARLISRTFQSIPGFNNLPTVSPNATLLLISIVIMMATVVLSSGAMSIWHGSKRTNIELNEGRAATAKSSGMWIVGFEAFSSILLITVAILSVVGFAKLSHQPSGFGTGSAVLASLDTPSEKIARILNQIRNSPGVEAVAMVNVPPLEGVTTNGTIEVHSSGGAVIQRSIWPADVSAEYFSAIGTKIIRGRAFTKDDVLGDPVCVLSSHAASALFRKENPVGAGLYHGNVLSCRVVGVAEDAHFVSLSSPPELVVYRLFKRSLPNIIVMAVSSDLAVQAVHHAVDAIDPAALAGGTETVKKHIKDDLRLWRALTLSGALCACVAAIILFIGFFGVLSIQVAERRRDIGIRVALGASPAQVCASLLRTLRRPVAAGLALGSGVALIAATRLAEIYHLNSTFVIGSLLESLVLLGILVMAAAFLPLKRALAISPAECLVSE